MRELVLYAAVYLIPAFLLGMMSVDLLRRHLSSRMHQLLSLYMF
ncbi:hypothetical protein [Alkalicoccus luteus]